MKRIEALGFLVLVALPASLAAAQPAGPHSPPPGVEHPYAAPSFPDVPPAELRAIASASGELPPLPQWCDGTCVIDIAFFYDPEAIGQTNGSAFPHIDTGEPDRPFGPQTVGERRVPPREAGRGTPARRLGARPGADRLAGPRSS